MSDPLDQELRRALRPVDPGDDFTRAVMARVTSNVTDIRHSPGMKLRTRVYSRALPWAPAALAASLLIAIVMTHQHRQEAENIAQGQRAREELLQALRMTSEKLDIAYQVVQSETNTDMDAGV